MTELAGSEVQRALRTIVPAAAAIEMWRGDDVPSLYPDEASAVERAVESRRVEFARGRWTARRALEALGCPPCGIPVGDHRQPIWPTGFIGSITHCEGLVAAVAARAADLTAIGIDAEPARPLPPDTRSSILGPTEMHGEGLEETVAFSAKESIHKALFPLTGVWLDFLDVELVFDPDRIRFTASPAPHAKHVVPQLPDLVGRSVIAGRYLATVSYLKRA